MFSCVRCRNTTNNSLIYIHTEFLYQCVIRMSLSQLLQNILTNPLARLGTNVETSNPVQSLYLKHIEVTPTPLCKELHDAFLFYNQRTCRERREDRRSVPVRSLVQKICDENQKTAAPADPSPLDKYLDGVYCDFNLSMVQKNFLHFVASIFGAHLQATELVELERIIMTDFKKFFTIFLYLIYNANASHKIQFNNQQKRIRNIPLAKNFEHLHEQVHLITESPETFINFLLPQ